MTVADSATETVSSKETSIILDGVAHLGHSLGQVNHPVPERSGLEILIFRG